MTSKSDIWAVVPVKNFSAAKTRLAGVLQTVERSQLSRMMLDDVLDALSRSSRLAGVVVVTADGDVVDAAEAIGVRVFWETASLGPAKAVASAARQLARDGRVGILGIMADVPLVTAGEIDRLLALHADSPAVTLAPSRDGTGTNAVVCTPPDIIEPSFGTNSLATHLQNAKNRGIESIARDPHIQADLLQRSCLVAAEAVAMGDDVLFLLVENAQGQTHEVFVFLLQ